MIRAEFRSIFYSLVLIDNSIWIKCLEIKFVLKDFKLFRYALGKV